MIAYGEHGEYTELDLVLENAVNLRVFRAQFFQLVMGIMLSNTKP